MYIDLFEAVHLLITHAYILDKVLPTLQSGWFDFLNHVSVN